MKDMDDVTLVKMTLRGEMGAFEELVNRYQKVLYNTVLRIVQNADEAEDVTQSGFVKAFEHLGKYKPQHKFFSWLYRIVVNESLNVLRRRREMQGIDSSLTAAVKNPAESYEESEREDYIDRALQMLTPENRAVVVLRHFQDLTYREISQILDIPEKTVKSRLFTARQLLKDRLLKLGYSQ
jgi:RNA polymerase sigma-70 factor (ECF subfamily)